MMTKIKEQMSDEDQWRYINWVKEFGVKKAIEMQRAIEKSKKSWKKNQ